MRVRELKMTAADPCVNITTFAGVVANRLAHDETNVLCGSQSTTKFAEQHISKAVFFYFNI